MPETNSYRLYYKDERYPDTWINILWTQVNNSYRTSRLEINLAPLHWRYSSKPSNQINKRRESVIISKTELLKHIREIRNKEWISWITFLWWEPLMQAYALKDIAVQIRQLDIPYLSTLLYTSYPEWFLSRLISMPCPARDLIDLCDWIYYPIDNWTNTKDDSSANWRSELKIFHRTWVLRNEGIK